MLYIKVAKQFKKDIKRDKQSGKIKEDDFKELKKVMDILIEGKLLDEKYLSHTLVGNWKNYSECHIKPNWLLIYQQTDTTIRFARLGTHQQLFKI